MHGERPMQVRRSKKFRTHEVTHSHFPLTLNKLELSDVLTVGSWERVRAVLKTVHGFDTQLCSCHCIRRGGCLISTCVALLWWLTVNYRMTDTLSCFWGFFMFFLSLRAWWSSRSVCFSPNWSATPSSTGFLSTSQMLVSIYTHHFTIKIT